MISEKLLVDDPELGADDLELIERAKSRLNDMVGLRGRELSERIAAKVAELKQTGVRSVKRDKRKEKAKAKVAAASRRKNYGQR